MGMHDLLDDSGLEDEVKVDFLRRMRKETERIHVVVRDLLDYARPETAPLSTRAIASISEVVDDTVALVRPQKDFKGIETRLEIAPDLSVTLGAQRLTQVLLNLLLNAGAALVGDGRSSKGPPAIVVRASRKGSRVRIEIEDNGPGVPKDLVVRIFDPFVTTKDVGSGTGLGLAVCKGIVEGAGGKIWVDPDFAKGARFVVELPAA
jgi:signal transduction histidine kinase